MIDQMSQIIRKDGKTHVADESGKIKSDRNTNFLELEIS